MLWKVWLIILAAVSLVTFIFYAVDKSKAKRGVWRISEKTLLLLSFFGGAAGGYLAMHMVHHKTKKWHFHFIHVLALAWQIALLVYLFINRNIL